MLHPIPYSSTTWTFATGWPWLQGSNLATVARALTLHCPLPPPPREELPYASLSDVGGVPAVPLNALLGLVAVMGGGSSQAKLQLGFWTLDRWVTHRVCQ
jgi:hypothetical protein